MWHLNYVSLIKLLKSKEASNLKSSFGRGNGRHKGPGADSNRFGEFGISSGVSGKIGRSPLAAMEEPGFVQGQWEMVGT